MRIALTGATGFLGRYLIDQLILDGHDVCAWYRNRPRKTPLDQRVEWVQGELGNAADAHTLVRGCDAIVHSGLARSGKSFLDSGDDPLRYWHRNATGSLQLLNAAQRSGAQRFVFISSGAVHDHVLPDRPLDETHPLLPETLYGACKASVETLVHHYGASDLINAATIRPTSIYGLADPATESKWYPMVQDICQGRAVTATGGSKTVHGSDVAKAVSLLLHTDQNVAGQTFNCCDRMISDYEVATIAKKLTGSRSTIHGAAKLAKHQIDTTKIQELGMRFGGDELLEQTIRQLVATVESPPH